MLSMRPQNRMNYDQNMDAAAANGASHLHIYDSPNPAYDFSPMSPMYDPYNQLFHQNMNYGNFNLGVQQTQQSEMNKMVLEPGLVKQRKSIEQQMLQNMSAEKASLYKTELCKKWMTTGTCRYGVKCQFAHGHDELRTLIRHPLYKTTRCKTYQATGSCRYGTRCRFIHNESDMELNSVPRMPPKPQFSPPSPVNDSSYGTQSQMEPSYSSGYEMGVRFNNQVAVEESENEHPIKDADVSTVNKFKLSKRVPSAPANLNLMMLEAATESLNLGIDDEEGYDFNYEESQAANTASNSLRAQAIKRNLTYVGLSEADVGVNGFRHNSHSVTDFTRNWSFNDKEELRGPEASAKDLPIASSRSNELHAANMGMRSAMSTSKLSQVSLHNQNRASYQNLNTLHSIPQKPIHNMRMRHGTEENVQINFFRSISDPELADLN